MRAVFVVLLNDLRRQMRDRPAVAVALLAPVVFTLIATTALGRLSHSFEATYALVDEDGGLVDDLLVGAVLGQEDARGAISFRRFASTDASYAAARAGDVAAVFVVERGAGAALRAGEVPGLRVAPSPSHPAGASLAAAIGQAFVTQMAANRLAVETALAVPGGGATLSRDELVARARGLRLPLGLDAQAVDDAGKAGLAVYYGPSMALVVLLVVVQMGARGLVAERENGTFARMLSLGVSPMRLLAAKALLSLLLGMGAMSSTLWLVGALTGARWGNVVLAAGVCLATVSAFAAVGAAITIVCPTEDAAAGLGLVAGIFLALLGGNFVPLSQAPELLQRLGVLTPNRWALGAFSRLGVDRAGVADLLPWVGGLVAYAAVFIAVAVVLGRRRVALG